MNSFKGPASGIPGNVIFSPGKGIPGQSPPICDGHFIFMLADGQQFMRIENDGKFFVQGRQLCIDMDIYNALKEWMARSKISFDGPNVVVSSA